MKPTFALDLTRDTIGLLHRTPKGWLSIGEVAFDAPDLAEALAANSKATDAVIARLTASGIEARDMQTSNLSINPNWTGYDSSTPTISGDHGVSRLGILGQGLGGSLALRRHTDHQRRHVGRGLDGAGAGHADGAGKIIFGKNRGGKRQGKRRGKDQGRKHTHRVLL